MKVWPPNPTTTDKPQVVCTFCDQPATFTFRGWPFCGKCVKRIATLAKSKEQVE